MDEEVASIWSTPKLAPMYPPFPIKYRDVEILTTVYRTDQEAIDMHINPPLKSIGNHYLATSRNGLLFASTNQTAFGPLGPETRNAYDIKVLQNGDVWVATGGRTPLWGAVFRRDQLFYKSQGFWRVLREPDAGYPLGHADLLAIAPDSDDPKHLFVAAGITGLYEINNYTYTSIS